MKSATEETGGMASASHQQTHGVKASTSSNRRAASSLRRVRHVQTAPQKSAFADEVAALIAATSAELPEWDESLHARTRQEAPKSAVRARR